MAGYLRHKAEEIGPLGFAGLVLLANGSYNTAEHRFGIEQKDFIPAAAEGFIPDNAIDAVGGLVGTARVIAKGVNWTWDHTVGDPGETPPVSVPGEGAMAPVVVPLPNRQASAVVIFAARER